MQVELKIIAVSAAFILYKIFSSFRTRFFSSTGRVESKWPKLGSAGTGAGFLVAVEGVLRVVGEFPEGGTNVSVIAVTMITVER